MSTSMGHDLTHNDPADQPRCPMEALADRINDAKTSRWITKRAFRNAAGGCVVDITAYIHNDEDLDDLIAFLQEVRG